MWPELRLVVGPAGMLTWRSWSPRPVKDRSGRRARLMSDQPRRGPRHFDWGLEIV